MRNKLSLHLIALKITTEYLEDLADNETNMK